MGVRLGVLQTRILKYLALHPRQNAQAIQQALEIPDKNYPSVWNALQKMEKQGFVSYEDAISKKNVPIKNWLLTDKGLLQALLLCDFTGEEMQQALANYAENEFTKRFLKLTLETLGPDLTKKILSWSVGGVASLLLGGGLYASLLPALMPRNGLTIEEIKQITKLAKQAKKMDKRVAKLYEALEELSKNEKKTS